MGTMTSQTHETWVPEWTFGDRVRKVRRAKGLSQTELARDLGVKTPSIAAWESGANMPRNVVSIAQRIELAYGVPATWVLGLETRNPHPGGPGGESQTPGAYVVSTLRRTRATAA